MRRALRRIPALAWPRAALKALRYLLIDDCCRVRFWGAAIFTRAPSVREIGVSFQRDASAAIVRRRTLG